MQGTTFTASIEGGFPRSGLHKTTKARHSPDFLEWKTIQLQLVLIPLTPRHTGDQTQETKNPTTVLASGPSTRPKERDSRLLHKSRMAGRRSGH